MANHSYDLSGEKLFHGGQYGRNNDSDSDLIHDNLNVKSPSLSNSRRRRVKSMGNYRASNNILIARTPNDKPEFLVPKQRYYQNNDDLPRRQTRNFTFDETYIDYIKNNLENDNGSDLRRPIGRSKTKNENDYRRKNNREINEPRFFKPNYGQMVPPKIIPVDGSLSEEEYFPYHTVLDNLPPKQHKPSEPIDRTERYNNYSNFRHPQPPQQKQLPPIMAPTLPMISSNPNPSPNQIRNKSRSIKINNNPYIITSNQNQQKLNKSIFNTYENGDDDDDDDENNFSVLMNPQLKRPTTVDSIINYAFNENTDPTIATKMKLGFKNLFFKSSPDNNVDDTNNVLISNKMNFNFRLLKNQPVIYQSYKGQKGTLKNIGADQLLGDDLHELRKQFMAIENNIGTANNVNPIGYDNNTQSQAPFQYPNQGSNDDVDHINGAPIPMLPLKNEAPVPNEEVRVIGENVITNGGLNGGYFNMSHKSEKYLRSKNMRDLSIKDDENLSDYDNSIGDQQYDQVRDDGTFGPNVSEIIGIHVKSRDQNYAYSNPGYNSDDYEGSVLNSSAADFDNTMAANKGSNYPNVYTTRHLSNTDESLESIEKRLINTDPYYNYKNLTLPSKQKRRQLKRNDDTDDSSIFPIPIQIKWKAIWRIFKKICYFIIIIINFLFKFLNNFLNGASTINYHEILKFLSEPDNIIKIISSPGHYFSKHSPTLPTIVIMVEILLLFWVVYELSIIIDTICTSILAVLQPFIAMGRYLKSD